MVLFAFLLFRLCLWLLYLLLNVPPVDPIYFFVEEFVFTSASYTRGPSRHSPRKGQFSGTLQLHVLGSLFSGLLLFMTLLLCFVMCLSRYVFGGRIAYL